MEIFRLMNEFVFLRTFFNCFMFAKATRQRGVKLMELNTKKNTEAIYQSAHTVISESKRGTATYNLHFFCMFFFCTFARIYNHWNAKRSIKLSFPFACTLANAYTHTYILCNELVCLDSRPSLSSTFFLLIPSKLQIGCAHKRIHETICRRRRMNKMNNKRPRRMLLKNAIFNFYLCCRWNSN